MACHFSDKQLTCSDQARACPKSTGSSHFATATSGTSRTSARRLRQKDGGSKMACCLCFCPHFSASTRCPSPVQFLSGRVSRKNSRDRATLPSSLAWQLRGIQGKRSVADSLTISQCACMKTQSPFGIRLWILIAALVLVAGGTIYGLTIAWRRFQHLESALNRSQIESFRLAGEVQRELLRLNNSMLRYAVLRDARQWEQFVQASDELNRWIDSHDPSMNPTSTLTTEAERRLLQDLNHAYDDYLTAAQVVHSNTQPPLVNSGQLTQLDAFDAQAERMRDLARKLSQAHRT